MPPADARPPRRVPAVLRRGLHAVAAAALVVTALAVPATPAVAHPAGRPGAAEDGEGGDRPPLSVTIDTMTPAAVPRRGRITLTGRITNDSEETWTDLDVYLFASTTPMTTSAELEEATATGETADVGGRLTGPGQYDEVDDLEPGETTDYRISLPRADLGLEAPGVYWIGVHVLGTTAEGRLEGADGRARTFITSMAPRGPRATLSLVLPLRAPVRRTTEGRLDNVDLWTDRFADDGRLRRLLDLARTGSDVPVTWLVDPAVLEAARSLGEGNPDFDLTTSAAGPDGETPGGVVTESPGQSEGATPDGPDDPEEELTRISPEAAAAATWLEDFTELATEHTVLHVPYADVDAASLLRSGFDETFAAATELGERAMADLGVESEPVVAPLDGLLPNAALEHLDADTDLLLSQRAAPRTDAGVVQVEGDTEAVLTSEAARVGGPAPTAPFAALALRQRILAEAAVHALSGPAGQPLVVSLPELWDPGVDWPVADFFGGLEAPWLSLVDVPFARATSTPEPYDGQLFYSRASRRAEIPDANVLATQDLTTAGSLLGDLLTGEDSISEQVGRAALAASSVHARRQPRRAVLRTRRIAGEVRGRLQQVTIEGSPLVTMSSETGNFSVTVVNGLAEPVTVGIKAQTGSEDLVIRAPDLVSLGAGQRASVRLAVTATDTGVHSVRLLPTTRDGRELGHSTTVKVRSSQVGLVIWLVMGVGGIVFVAAIVVRIWRRVRDSRRGPETEPGSGTA
ncbi:DUF6049 family protein [Nocardioides pakistanensis]